MQLATYRRTSQIAFLVLTLAGILFGLSATGIIYPYFFCYSCPWDIGACPIGILEHSVIDIQIEGLFWTGMAMLGFLIGFMVLIGMIFGRGFCGWGCPVGALQDVTRKTGIGKFLNKKIGGEIDHRVKYIKYLILISIPILSYWAKDLFYTTFCPVGGITGTVPTLTFYFSEWTLGTTFPIKITSIVLFVILILLVVRGWCKYLCPVGAFLAPLNYKAGVNLSRKEETCANCNLCERACPMDVKGMGRHEDAECILCGRCVDVCRHKSLKLGSRFAKGRMVGFLPWIIVIILASSLMISGAYYSGYERVDAINAIPCLGCLALDPVSPDDWFFYDEDTNTHQQFVLDDLESGPVFLHYRTIVCAACDEMEPYIEELEEDYGNRIKFIHINLDLAPEDEVASYYDYDILGTPDDTSGVPLFAIVTLNETADGNVPIFKSVYGSSSDGGRSKKGDLEKVIVNATAMYQEVAGSIVIIDSEKMPMVELFVDMNCVWCPSSEDALVELEHEGITNYITYTTDVVGVSGNYSTYREIEHQGSINGLTASQGHPWAVFNGGPINNLGGGGGIKDDYLVDLAVSGYSPVNLSIDGTLGEESQNLQASITLSNPDEVSQSIDVKAMLVEKISQFPNIRGDPIPNAFIDILVNQTYDIGSGETEAINVTWDGTDVLPYSDFRLSNLALVVSAWEDGVLINSKTIDAGIEEALLWEVDDDHLSVRPNTTAYVELTLWNYLDSELTVNLSAIVPNANWVVNLSADNATIPALGSHTITADITNSDTALGDLAEIRIRARGVIDSTVDISRKIEIVVKDDILPPTIASSDYEPREPLATDQINMSAMIGDLSPLKSVKLLYYSCTDEVCSPTFELNMTTQDGNTYTASAFPVEVEHNIFHYKIIATDEADNVQESEWYDVELEPVLPPEHHQGGDTGTFNTFGIAGLLIFAMVAIGLNIARIKQNPKKKIEKKEDEEEISKEPDVESLEEVAPNTKQ
ncbi:MAG: 4Fe-4S binding protein [Thermoplasmata archaeon]|nr:4Fe-4S binding protein [Thermoplasmata archaeon]